MLNKILIRRILWTHHFIFLRIQVCSVILQQLDCPGGLVTEGLAIGATIRDRGYTTAVPDDAKCASVCGLMWLGGVKRLVGEKGNVGFHAAYRGRASQATESGSANAIVGAYLTELGLSIPAIVYVTSAPPNDMRWLTPADARRLGIALTIVPSERATPATYPFQMDQPASAPSRQPLPAPSVSGSSQEQQAVRVLLGYYALWSQTVTNVEGLAAYYPDMVSYYGALTSRSKVMDEKRKFSLRWPDRTYVVRPGTLSAQCGEVCTVSGVVEWDTKSIARNDHSIGSANFTLRIALNGSPIGGVIVSENGGVISGHKEALNQSPDQTRASLESPVVGQGRQARRAFDQWYSGLADGAYRDGAYYWTANRSMTPTPNCYSSRVAEWIQGCFDAKARLDTADFRRKNEKDFWLGWNSP